MHFTGSLKNPEQHVAYFGEDIGMNVHHVTWHMDFPFWWDDAYGFHLDRKGELFFWAHHQLTVRFDAERLSNHLDMVHELYWDQPIHEGFAPHATYRYGGEFPARPDDINFADVEGVIRVRDMIIFESRIRDAIAHGYITAADGSHVDIMNNEGIDHLEISLNLPSTVLTSNITVLCIMELIFCSVVSLILRGSSIYLLVSWNTSKLQPGTPLSSDFTSTWTESSRNTKTPSLPTQRRKLSSLEFT